MVHIKEGRTYNEVATFLCVKPETVKGWIKRFKDSGLAGLKESYRSGAKRKLASHQEAEFKAATIALQEEREGGRITGHDVQKLLNDTFQVDCKLSSTYNYLHQVDLSWITVRSKHPKQDPEKQVHFKKTFKP